MRNEPLVIFIVTVSGSLYRATTELGIVEGRSDVAEPILEKLAGSEESKVKVGQRLYGGQFCGFSLNYGMMEYIPDHYLGNGRPQYPSYTNTAYWGWHTSPIVGLFMEEASARTCLGWSDLQKWDPRCTEATYEAIRAIGADHDVFILDPEVLAMTVPIS